MDRRDISKALLATAGASALLTTRAEAQTCSSYPINACSYGATGNDMTDDTAALQSWLNASAGRTAYLPKGTYRITSQLTAPDRTTIIGDGRDVSLLRYVGLETIGGGAMLRFANSSAFRVSGIGFRCTRAEIGNSTVQLHLQDCVYFEVSDVSFGATGANSFTNNIRGCLCDQTSAGLVPPRGNGVFRNILYVVEPTDSGASGSRGIHIKGHPSQPMNHVILDGEGNIEHAYYGVVFENANNCYLGPWQMRGSTNTEIVLTRSSNCMIIGPQIVPPPTVGTGISLDASCLDNVIINPAWNFSSGTPLAAISDNGMRTTVIAPGAPGVLQVQGKLNGSFQLRKADGVGNSLEVIRSTTDTNSGVVVRSDANPLAKAFLAINRGSGPAAQDILRIEGGAALFERVGSDGRHYLHVPTSAPLAGEVGQSQMSFYLDENTNQLKVLVRYSNGILKSGMIPLT
ncbi:MAG: hypothetical protein HC872_01085 [Gammaproteobacteria bacterium]|nr:hypothetical protein [Gammaproteobacteria bacterium]